MGLLDDLRGFFFPKPVVPKRAEYAPPRKPPPKEEEVELPLMEVLPGLALYLPKRVADQIQRDIKRALAFTYTGREKYREMYINAGIPPELIPEEELEELPGAEGIRIPILGWRTPSKQVRGIVKDWWESVAAWTDLSLALEIDFAWKPLLKDWGIENLRLDAKQQVLDAAGNVLPTAAGIKKEYPLGGAILDWIKYGGVHGERLKRFPTVKEKWLNAVKGHIPADQPFFTPAFTTLHELSQWRAEKKAKGSLPPIMGEIAKREESIKKLWRDFGRELKEGKATYIPRNLRDLYKLIEYRGLQFEAHDRLDRWKEEGYFRTFIWGARLRPAIERQISWFLHHHPQVYSFLFKIFSPILSSELTKDLLDQGRLLPNRLIMAFLRRAFKQKFPKEILSNLRGTLSPALFAEIRRRPLAELEAILPPDAFKALKGGFYTEWERWFLPGRFIEWAGRHLTGIQQNVLGWVETQYIEGTLLGKVLHPVIRGRGAFIAQALAKGGTVRVAAAKLAKSLWRRGLKWIAKALVKVVQGISSFIASPAGAAILTAITFAVTKILGWVWGKVKEPLWEGAKGIAVAGCGCAVLFFGVLLFVVLAIFSAFVPWEVGGALQPAVQVVKTASPEQIPADGGSHLVSYTIAVTNSADEDAAVSLHDEKYGGNFSATVPAGAVNQEIGSFEVSVPTTAGKDDVISNKVSGTATIGGEETPLEATGFLIVGSPPDSPPSGWPTDSRRVTLTYGVSHPSEGRHTGFDIGRKDPGAGGYDRIYSTLRGRAYWYFDSGGYGWTVEVVSENGLYKTRYCHLQPMQLVISGKQVDRGTLIGLMGDSGATYGIHLHYEVYDKGARTDPAPFIPYTCGPVEWGGTIINGDTCQPG